MRNAKLRRRHYMLLPYDIRVIDGTHIRRRRYMSVTYTTDAIYRLLHTS